MLIRIICIVLLVSVCAVVVSGGTLRRITNLGLRPLAYRMTAHHKKNTIGRYLKVSIQANPLALRDFERRIRADEEIVRFLTLKNKSFAPGNDVEAFGRLPSPPESQLDKKSLTSLGQPSLLAMTQANASGSSYKLPAFQLRDLDMPFSAVNLLQRRTLIDYFAARTLLQYGAISRHDIKQLPRHRAEPHWDAQQQSVVSEVAKLRDEALAQSQVKADKMAASVAEKAHMQQQHHILYALTHMAVKEQQREDRETEKAFQIRVAQHRMDLMHQERQDRRARKLANKVQKVLKAKSAAMSPEEVRNLEAQEKLKMVRKQRHRHNLIKDTIISTDTETLRMIADRMPKLPAEEQKVIEHRIAQAAQQRHDWRQRAIVQHPIDKIIAQQPKRVETNQSEQQQIGAKAASTDQQSQSSAATPSG